MTDQVQKGGDKSTNIQAESITIIQQGLTVTEARAIALDVFRSNFYELSGQAKDVARQRAEEITEEFLGQLQKQNPAGISQAHEPDFQHSLFTAQREYARCGDKELGDLLVDLLVDRTKHSSRSILQIVLNESLTVASKLTTEQLAALSTIFLFRHTMNYSIVDHNSFWSYLDQYISPFASLVSPKLACYQHLEYAGCGNVGIGSISLEEIFFRTYGGLFLKGFDVSEIQARALTEWQSSKLFGECLNDKTKLQVSCINEDTVRKVSKELNLLSDAEGRAVDLFNSTRMNGSDIRDMVIKARPYMENVFDVWNKSNMGHFTMTSVGIAVGHANVKKNTGEFTDLSIWIN